MATTRADEKVPSNAVYVAVVRVLLDAGASVDAKKRGVRETALQRAVLAGAMDEAAALVQAGASTTVWRDGDGAILLLSVCDAAGETLPTMIRWARGDGDVAADRTGYAAVVRVLLERGASVDAMKIGRPRLLWSSHARRWDRTSAKRSRWRSARVPSTPRLASRLQRCRRFSMLGHQLT